MPPRFLLFDTDVVGHLMSKFFYFLCLKCRWEANQWSNGNKIIVIKEKTNTRGRGTEKNVISVSTANMIPTQRGFDLPNFDGSG